MTPTTEPLIPVEFRRAELPVLPGSRYTVRCNAVDSIDSAGPRGLVAQVEFLDVAGCSIAVDYTGCFRSDRFGQFIYLATRPPSSSPDGADRAVEAPAGAVLMKVAIHPWKASSALQVSSAPEIRNADKSVLFEHASAVSAVFPQQFHVGIIDAVDSVQAAVLEVKYLTEDGTRLPGPYPGCFESNKFGQFTYLPVKGRAPHDLQVELHPPEGAASAVFVGHRWKGTASLAVHARPRVAHIVPNGVVEPERWRAVPADGLEVFVELEPSSADRLMVLSGHYFAAGASDAALRVAVHFVDASGQRLPPQSDVGEGLASPIHELGATQDARPMSLLTWCPAGARTARLLVQRTGSRTAAGVHGEVVATTSEPMVGHLAFHSRVGQALSADLKHPAFGEWRMRVLFEAIGAADPTAAPPQLFIRFVDGGGRTLELSGIDYRIASGRLSRRADTLELIPSVGPTGNSRTARFNAEIQVLPPPKAAGVEVEIGNTASTGDLPYTCEVEPCDALAESRIHEGSAAVLSKVEEQSPEAARSLADALREKFPDDAGVISGLLDVYRRLGDASGMSVLAQRALALPSMPGKLRYKARHVLSSLTELDPDWQIQVPGDWSGSVSATRAPGGPLRVAHLFKTSVPHENTGGAIRCLNIVKFQKQIGMEPVVVTPLGYPDKNVTGEVWEREEIEGVPHFRLNGISREDIRTIPSTKLLEYSALLTANLLRAEGVDLVQASSGYRGYEQALIGKAVADKLQVPFVYEVRSYHEHTWRPMADWVVNSDFTKLRMAQEDRCMHEADAVVTICHTMKRGLIERGIPADKIFVVPNSVDLEKFEPSDPDPELRERLKLSANTTVGYISNISKREGHDVLLRAVARARAEGADIDCLIVGTGPELNKLKSLASSLGLEEYVTFTGEVPHHAISDYYALIDIFVIPRVQDFASDFVTPMKPFEAMAMKKALVISDRPALREIVEPGVRGLEFSASDHVDLSAKLLQLAGSPDLLSRYALAGFDWVRSERTWSNTIKLYAEAYSFASDATRFKNQQRPR